MKITNKKAGVWWIEFLIALFVFIILVLVVINIKQKEDVSLKTTKAIQAVLKEASLNQNFRQAIILGTSDCNKYYNFKESLIKQGMAENIKVECKICNLAEACYTKNKNVYSSDIIISSSL